MTTAVHDNNNIYRSKEFKYEQPVLKQKSELRTFESKNKYVKY